MMTGGAPEPSDEVNARPRTIGTRSASKYCGVTYVMLTQVFRARADVNELVRVMGFAAAPLALTVGLVIPGLDYGIGLAALGLTFGTTQIAIQSATDAPAGKALIANAAGFAVWVIVVQLFVGATNTYAPGIFIFAPR